jgi:hypothetical protein
MRTFPVTTALAALLAVAAVSHAQPAATQPSKLAAERAQQLTTRINSFTIHFLYLGRDHSDYDSLLLAVPAMPPGPKTSPISQAQARKLIDCLTAAGLLDRAKPWPTGGAGPKVGHAPTYVLSLSGLYWVDLGWGLPLLERLDRLRQAMDGDAATKMDRLLGRLAGDRERWQRHAATRPAPAAIAFDTYDGYFVSNKFEPDAAASFVIIRDQKAFDGIFGTAMVMGDKSHRLPADAFDSKIVLAAIKRGKARWDLTATQVVADQGVLVVRYATRETGSDSAEFACPLIVSVPKGDYMGVEFVEDGKSVKKIEMDHAPKAQGNQ